MAMLVYQRVNQETKGLCHWVELSRSSLFGQALANPRFRGLKVGISFCVDPVAQGMSALNTLLRWLAMASLLFLEQTETPWLKVGCFILCHPSYKQISVLKKEKRTTASKQILQRVAGCGLVVSVAYAVKPGPRTLMEHSLQRSCRPWQQPSVRLDVRHCATIHGQSKAVLETMSRVFLQVLLSFVWLPTEYPRGGSLPWQAPSLDMIAQSQVSSAVSGPAAVIVEVWIYI